VDETLRLWGRNLAAARKAHRPDGMPKANSRDGMPCMSQTQLGALLDPPVTQVAVSRWERGLREPRRYHKQQLAGLLHTDVERLFPTTRVAA
jgi:transcriptional regulator with XRE-family HTH domain